MQRFNTGSRDCNRILECRWSSLSYWGLTLVFPWQTLPQSWWVCRFLKVFVCSTIRWRQRMRFANKRSIWEIETIQVWTKRFEKKTMSNLRTEFLFLCPIIVITVCMSLASSSLVNNDLLLKYLLSWRQNLPLQEWQSFYREGDSKEKFPLPPPSDMTPEVVDFSDPRTSLRLPSSFSWHDSCPGIDLGMEKEEMVVLLSHASETVTGRGKEDSSTRMMKMALTMMMMKMGQ